MNREMRERFYLSGTSPIGRRSQWRSQPFAGIVNTKISSLLVSDHVKHCTGSSATVVSNVPSTSEHGLKDAHRIITQFRLYSDR